MQGFIRRDPVSHRWVTFAPEKAQSLIRSSREIEPSPIEGSGCPFCPGNEEVTPHEILRYNNFPHLNPGWSLRVFPARNPLLRIEEDPHSRGNGIYDTMQRLGAHEVVVETPRHSGHLDEVSPEEIRDILRAWRERLADLQGDRRFKYLMVYKNRGREAGGTIDHHYSEIIAFPFVPSLVEMRFAHAAEYHAFRRRCVFCDMIAQEVEDKERIVKENDEFVAFCPYASRFPFEVWILPKRHVLHFGETPYEILLPLVVKSAVEAGWRVPAEVRRRVLLIAKLVEEKDILTMVQLYKRSRNILKGVPPDEGTSFDDEKLIDPAEQDLAKALYATQATVAAAPDALTAAHAIIALKPAIDRFFDEVLVMTDDPVLRNNRIALIREIVTLVTDRIGDISWLGV